MEGRNAITRKDLVNHQVTISYSEVQVYTKAFLCVCVCVCVRVRVCVCVCVHHLFHFGGDVMSNKCR